MQIYLGNANILPAVRGMMNQRKILFKKAGNSFFFEEKKNKITIPANQVKLYK